MEQVISQDDSSKIIPPDIQFTMKCYKLLRKLGYIKSQYEFSEQTNKNIPRFVGGLFWAFCKSDILFRHT